MIYNTYNLYNKTLSDFTIDLDSSNIIHTYNIKNTTPFSEYYLEWAVFINKYGDMIYVPSGNNRSRYVYIVDIDCVRNIIKYPYGIYIIPMSQFYGSFR